MEQEFFSTPEPQAETAVGSGALPLGFDFLATLNAHLTKVMAKPKLEEDLAKAKRIAANKRAPDADRIAAARAITAIQQQLIPISWTAQANVAVFRRATCSCGAVNHSFVRLMQRIISNSRPFVERWASGLDLNNDLPKEVIFQDAPTTPICHHCTETQGFALSLGVVKHIETHSS